MGDADVSGLLGASAPNRVMPLVLAIMGNLAGKLRAALGTPRGLGVVRVVLHELVDPLADFVVVDARMVLAA
jgi:hypothetical protein